MAVAAITKYHKLSALSNINVRCREHHVLPAGSRERCTQASFLVVIHLQDWSGSLTPIFMWPSPSMHVFLSTEHSFYKNIIYQYEFVLTNCTHNNLIFKQGHILSYWSLEFQHKKFSGKHFKTLYPPRAIILKTYCNVEHKFKEFLFLFGL